LDAKAVSAIQVPRAAPLPFLFLRFFKTFSFADPTGCTLVHFAFWLVRQGVQTL